MTMFDVDAQEVICRGGTKKVHNYRFIQESLKGENLMSTRQKSILCTLLFIVLFCLPFSDSKGQVEPLPAIKFGLTFITKLPYTISEPGSYKVMADLVGIAGSHGITIDSSNVTLDLNGFSLHGVGGSGGIHR